MKLCQGCGQLLAEDITTCPACGNEVQEGSGDKNKAIDHYREALGSYMDDMTEYVFAVERIKKLRQPSQ